MDQHPIPRQITTFEFKLIGFMTLKQFLYLVVFGGIGYVVYALLPIPILDIVLGIVISAIGAAFAFIPMQDRSLDVWLKNLVRRLNSPTQFMYKKKNDPMYFIKNLYFVSDPHLAVSHIETKGKLQEYLQAKQQQETADNKQRTKQKVHIEDLLKQNLPVPNMSGQSGQTVRSQAEGVVKQPFLSGVVKNRKQIAIPGIIVTIKDTSGKQLRILKTNPYGIFATYSPLPEGDYLFEVSDPNDNYFFDTMNVHVNPKEQKPLVFYSKEIL